MRDLKTEPTCQIRISKRLSDRVSPVAALLGLSLTGFCERAVCALMSYVDDPKETRRPLLAEQVLLAREYARRPNYDLLKDVEGAVRTAREVLAEPPGFPDALPGREAVRPKDGGKAAGNAGGRGK